MNNIDPERLPSLPLAVAGALARAGWSAEKIADGTGLPRAFAELQHDRAVQDGEVYPSADERLLAALLDRIRRRVSEPNLSRGTRSTPQGTPVTARPLPAESATRHQADPALAAVPRRRRASPTLAIASALTCALAAALLLIPGVSGPAHLGVLVLALTCLTMTVRQARRLVRPRTRAHSKWAAHAQRPPR